MQVGDLIKTLDTMEVPAFRKALSMSNVRWLLRNLRVHNAQHARIDEVIGALKNIVRIAGTDGPWPKDTSEVTKEEAATNDDYTCTPYGEKK